MNENAPAENVEKPVETATKPIAPPRDDFYLDWFERWLIAGFYGWFVVRLVNSYLEFGPTFNLFMIPSEGLVLVFVIIRRSSQAMTRQPFVWIVAFGAGLIPLLATPGRPLQSPLFSYLCGITMIMGIVLQVHAKISLGRSFGCVPAHRGLRFSGPYRFMRHPMYSGYLLTYFSFLGLNPSWWNLAVYSICLGLMIARIVLEERLLSNDPEYRAYQEEVPYRLIPGLF